MYGIDLAEPGLLKARSWRWLDVRVAGLLTTSSRLQREFNPNFLPRVHAVIDMPKGG